ncbi:MAG TPA: ATP-dependent zinc metalloprotease FtsH [Planctomycetes bacterium]|nr:ATP-dependent zinc metalloprotease FtsH [Planctomycetota bacterium]
MTKPPENDKGKQQAAKKPKGMGGVFIIALLLFLLFMFVNKAGNQHKDTIYDFWRHLYNADFTKVTIGADNQVAGTYRKDGHERHLEVAFKRLTPEERQTIQDIQALDLDRSYDQPDGLARFKKDLVNGKIQAVKAWLVRVTGKRPGEDRVSTSKDPDAYQDTMTLYAIILRGHDESYVRVPISAPGAAPKNPSLKAGTLQDLSQALGVSGKLRHVFLHRGQKFEIKQVDQLTYYLLGSILPWILIIGLFWFFIIRQMRSPGGGGGVLNFGRSRAQKYTKEQRTQVTFEDVQGMKEAKEEVQEVIEFLKNPEKFQRLGGHIPRGVLLVGPPGTGKTLLAKAIAGEAEVPFFSISGSDFVEMFVGVGASRVRDLFKQARESAPCIVFLDEVDAVGRKRGAGLGGGHDEREQTLNAILVEMDGFDTDQEVILIGATNRPDVLDPALLRPGRFDRQVVIDMPDAQGREAILQVHAKRVRMAPDIPFERLARATPGFSGAELAALINEAAILAGMSGAEEIRWEHLEEARDRVRWGREKKSRKFEEEDRKVTAYHEAGHALVGALIKEVDPVHKVTIISRGMALGATMYLPEKEDYHMRRSKLLGMIAMSYGGRIAEEVVFDDISAGAQNDIKQATNLAKVMVTELGMSDKVGPLNYSESTGNDFLGRELHLGRDHSEETSKLIDEEIRRITREGYDRAKNMILEHRDALDRIAGALLRFETITGEEVQALMAGASIDDIGKKRWEEKEISPPPLKKADGPSETQKRENPEDDIGFSGAEGLATP